MLSMMVLLPFDQLGSPYLKVPVAVLAARSPSNSKGLGFAPTNKPTRDYCWPGNCKHRLVHVFLV